MNKETIDLLDKQFKESRRVVSPHDLVNVRKFVYQLAEHVTGLMENIIDLEQKVAALAEELERKNTKKNDIQRNKSSKRNERKVEGSAASATTVVAAGKH